MAPLLRHLVLSALATATAATAAAAERGGAPRAGGWPEPAWAGEDECSVPGGCSLALLQLRARGAPAEGGGNGTAPGDAAEADEGGLATDQGGLPGGWGEAADFADSNRSFDESDQGGSGNLTIRVVHDRHNTKELYHQTGGKAGPLILRHGFKAGRHGWCGGGIYFATNPEATNHKAIGPDSHKGYMIKAAVALGRVRHMSNRCDWQMTGEKLRASGYDSISFNPGDGVEYVVYSGARVLWTKHV